MKQDEARKWETLATESIADAGEWKREVMRLRAINAELVAKIKEYHAADVVDPLCMECLFIARAEKENGK